MQTKDTNEVYKVVELESKFEETYFQPPPRAISG